MKFTPAEQLSRKRERNKVHAKKTRERKRQQTSILQHRINELKDEGDRLRQLADDRYMASTLLGLSCNNGSDLFSTKESSEICRNYYVEVAMGENGLLAEGKKEAKAVRRINKSGEKDTLEEKERRRRERNRMHARRTREKTRNSFELRGTIIGEMTDEIKLLRSYLVLLGVITHEEVEESCMRDVRFKQQNDHLLRHASIDSMEPGDSPGAYNDGRSMRGDDENDSSYESNMGNGHEHDEGDGYSTTEEVDRTEEDQDDGQDSL